MNMHSGHTAQRFDPARVERLLSPDRAGWLRPDLILRALALGPGLRALDVGAGPGYFTLPIAGQISPGGWVAAIDVEPAMLDYLLRRATQAAVSGIRPVLGNNAALPFRAAAFDRVLISLVLHEVDDPGRLLREAAGVLAPGGLAVIVEWCPGQTEHGPPPEHRLSPDGVTETLRAAGVSPQEPLVLSPDCYLQVATRPGQ